MTSKVGQKPAGETNMVAAFKSRKKCDITFLARKLWPRGKTER